MAMTYANIIDLRPGLLGGPGIVCLTVLARQVAHAAKLVGSAKVCAALRTCIEVLEDGDAEALDCAALSISRDCDR